MILNPNIKKRIRVIPDSSTQKFFILPETIKQLNILIQEKNKPYLFIIINRIIIKHNKKIIKYKIILIQVII
jgi:hypothetical protein